MDGQSQHSVMEEIFMKSVRGWLILWGVLTAASSMNLLPQTSAAGTRLMRYPDICRDQVVFVYAGDIWIAARTGGQARRLTAHPGDELFPKFSPDGQWVAFTGEYDGNADVYVIPATGGEPRRLSHHPANDMVLGWHPDGKRILFRSNRQSAPPDFTRLFLAPLEGGMPEMLPLPRASLSSFSCDGGRIAYNSTSQEFRTWKRYRGGWTNYIGIYDLKNNSYEGLPRSGAMDMFPMWHENAIYFISDRDGVMNLYRYDLGSKRESRLTAYKEFDVKWPSLGPDAIVYENGGLLYAYDLKGGKIQSIPVSVATDAVTARAALRNVAGNVGSFGLSPSGVRALFEAHGEVFTMPAEHGSVRNLTDSPGVHELNPVWSPDGKWIAYLSDRSGEYEIYLRPQAGGAEVRVTNDGDCYRYGPIWSPDSKKLTYWDKKLRLWYLDTQEKQPVLIDTADYESEPRPDWSPDSKWIAYGKQGPNLSDSIWLYSLEQKKAFQVTDGFYDASNPVFDQNGKYLYFLSSRFFYPTGSRFDARFGYFNTTGIFALTLKADEASPFGPQSDEEKAAEEKKTGDEKADKKGTEGSAEKKGEDKKPEAKPVQVDVEGLGQRISQVPVPAGIYRGLLARSEKLFYLALPMESLQAGLPGQSQPRGALHAYDVKKREDATLLQGIASFDLDKEGKKVIYQAGETYGIIDAAPGKKVGDGKLEMSTLETRVDPREEWRQIFREAWRIERDCYWDPEMGGLDWTMIGKRYEALLPWVAHRSDLNYIIGDMIAELSTSHTYVSGGEMPERRRVSVGMLGVDYQADGSFYRFKKIYRGENWDESERSPLTEPGLKVREGNYLIAVDGMPVRTTAEPYAYFQDLAGRLVTLKINDKPAQEGAWEISVKPTGSENGLRYFDWIESNRRKVAEATGGRVGYMHVPDTSISGLMMFDKYLGAQLGKDGMIIDERYNHGGMVPDFYTEKLGRKLLNLIAPREGKDIPYPPVAVYGPKVMIVNELAGSGGDAFPWFFRREKIGPIVGTRTWGGLVGISRQIPLLDGGNVTAPEVAFWSADNGGEWIVENHGVDPDVVVEQKPDLEVSGHDPQLEKALELVKEALKTYPPLPPRPKFPKKTTVPRQQ
jgi:tricorn protease